MNDLELRALWAKGAAKRHAWTVIPMTIPLMDSNGRSFVTGWHESEYQVWLEGYRAGLAAASPSEQQAEPVAQERIANALSMLQSMWDYCDDLTRKGRTFGATPGLMRAWSEALAVMEELAWKFASPPPVAPAVLTDEQIDAICTPSRAKRWKNDGRQYDRDTVRLVLAAAPQPATTPSTEAAEADLTARGMGWEETMSVCKEACEQAGVKFEERSPLAINVLQRAANLSHKRGFALALERSTKQPAGEVQSVVREFTNELGNRIKITIEGPTSTSENILTPMEVAQLKDALYTSPPPAAPASTAVPEGMALVPINVLLNASEALGNFVSDHGWDDSDMQAMDNLDAFLARHRANSQQNKEQG